MAEIKQHRKRNGDKIFPVTHVEAVIGNAGVPLSEILSNKQDALISGVNIKTINGKSIVGSGGIVIEGGGSGSSMDVDSTPTEGSVNLVTSGGVKEALDLVVDDLQGQIDAMIADRASVSLAVVPNLVYVGEETNVTLTAKVTGATASSIQIKKGSTILAEDTNKTQISVTDTITTSDNVSYSAEFVIRGITKTANITVTAVGKVYYGAGAVETDAITIASKRSTPAGTYSITVATDASYIFFVIPNSMTINSATMGGFEFPLDSPTTTTRDGVTYKVFKSSSTIDAGTHEIVIR